ncbi:MAG: Fic/DOC family N-terminal domain-containing protein [Saprospiraceae bacterium]
MKYFNKNIPFNDLPDLPPKKKLETTEILKHTIQANKLLAELKGFCLTLPNPNLLLNTIVLQESKESSAIENIVTTQDELYKATLDLNDSISNHAAKEVLLYRQAIYWGLEEMQKKDLITTNLMVGIMRKIKNTTQGIRKNPGTKLANPTTGKIIYTPPEGEEIIRKKLATLEVFINDDEYSSLDPLIKMALIHYQFEAIHPFGDGNGRTGRILNVLFLINKKLIGLPVIYLSYYIIQNKPDYYRLLREVTEKQNWQEWVIFILKGVAETSQMTLQKINAILDLKKKSEDLLRQTLKSSYSREFSDLLFSYPYIKIKVLEQHGIAKRQTASVYLQKLAQVKLLIPLKMGKETYYINHQLMNILSK